MGIEGELQDFIKTQYRSIREFALSIGMRQQTVDGILKRGIANANVSSMICICRHLGISLDALVDGKIVSASPVQSRLSVREEMVIKKFRAISDTEKQMVESMMDIAYQNSGKGESEHELEEKAM